MELHEIIDEELTTHFYGNTNGLEVVAPINECVNFVKNCVSDGDHIVSCVKGFLTGLSIYEPISHDDFGHTLRIVREVVEKNNYDTKKLITSTEKKLDEKNMSMEEKWDYLNDFPVLEKYFKDGQELELTTARRLDDALGGVGFMIATANMVIEATDEKTFNSYGKNVDITSDMFFLLDVCNDEEDIESYEFLGKNILDVLEEVIGMERMDLEYTEQCDYEWAIIDGKKVEYDELHRKMNEAQYKADFNIQ